MTWQLASACVLAAALAAGFGWYERSRPPARVLALVAALAALAAIGRVAFAAFPNVKPTSDIVLFSGYALGGAPGFAVGALAALVSNIFLGQGPWTPWQMAAWAVVGLGGAGLGRLLRGRRPSRLLLATACGLSGFVFGALMDAYQWTLAAEHSVSSYLAVSATSFTFNVAHALGNVAFALVLGPAFVRALERYRRRFEVRWIATAPRVAAALLCLSLAAGARPAIAGPPGDVSPALARAVRYLRFAQNTDGGFGAAPGQSSTQLHTGWAALGLASSARNPRDVRRSGLSVIDYVKAHAGRLGDIGELERTILVLHASGLRQRIGAHNLLRSLVARQRPDGSFGTINHTAFGVFALRAAGRPTRSKQVRAAVRSLMGTQNGDGGFGFARNAASDVDDTGAVVEALAAGGRRSSPVVARAIAYLRKAQARDGGFGQMPGAPSNAQSTAFAVQGLEAARVDPRELRRVRTPIEFLKSLQAADGSFRYSRLSAQTPVWVTAQVVVALEGKAYPLHPAPRRKAGTARIQIRPVANTTTQTSSGAQADPVGGSGDSTWAYVFAGALAVAALIVLRLAWRRG